MAVFGNPNATRERTPLKADLVLSDEMMRRSDRAIRPPSYFGFCDHSEENPNEDSVSASQRVSDDEQEDSYNETEDKI